MIEEHHEERLAEIINVLDAGSSGTVWDVSSKMTWSRGWDGIVGPMKFAAIGEIAAHLQVLEARDAVRKEISQEGALIYGTTQATKV
ncbi:MAG TPA: hypothetical protein VLZ31_01640 [Microbacteriaceae bacterium]|nr:hypothetical protein [Microbacteriaceae bacterium]